MDARSELTDICKQHIAEQATINKKTEKRELTEFEKKVNEAAVELYLRNANLLRKRGDLLEKARKKVADDGYGFKKECSRSKLYGHSGTSSTPKRPKVDKEMREERVKLTTNCVICTLSFYMCSATKQSVSTGRFMYPIPYHFTADSHPVPEQTPGKSLSASSTMGAKKTSKPSVA